MPPPEPTSNESQRFEAFREMVHNVLLSRSEFLKKFMDPRRSIEDECGYPPNVSALPAQYWKDLYEMEPFARRVVEVLPKESWQVQPRVYEDDDSTNDTAFEKAWDELGKGLAGQSWYAEESGSRVWDYLLRADILSGIGRYGVLLLGVDDGLALGNPIQGAFGSTTSIAGTKAQGSDAQYYDAQMTYSQPLLTNPTSPLPATNPIPSTSPPDPAGGSISSSEKTKRKLLFVRPFDESLLQITQYDPDPTSPRFGQPVMYKITLNSPNDQPQSGIGLPLATVDVHWSRVIHIADNLGSSEIAGAPRMRPVLYPILDARKVRGGSAEMYWRGAFPGLSLETNPVLGGAGQMGGNGDVLVDKQGIQDMMENYGNGLQRYITLMGMSAKTLAPQVVDPTPQITAQVNSICVQIGVPIPVFSGYEIGEQASTNNDESWNGRLAHRQSYHITPRIICPFVDRLIQIGVLPAPKKGYKVEWPDLDALTDAEKADVALKRAQALAQYSSMGIETILPLKEFLTLIMAMPDEEAQLILEALQAASESDDHDSPAPLLGLVGGITGMISLLQLAAQGGLSDEQLKQQIMLFFKVDEEKADALLGEGFDALRAQQDQQASADQQAQSDQSHQQTLEQIAAQQNGGNPAANVSPPPPPVVAPPIEPTEEQIKNAIEKRLDSALGDTDGK